MSESPSPHPQRTTRHTFCRICESLCGLRVEVENERVVEIRPDADHVATGGFGCVKGLKQHKLYDSPDRLRHPLVRSDVGDASSVRAGTRPSPTSAPRCSGWSRPMARTRWASTWAPPRASRLLHPIFAQGFMTGLGSKSIYASATQDCSNKFAVAREVHGFPFSQTFPDVDHTECLVIVGANPVVSKWSFLQVPEPDQAIARDRGARGAHLRDRSPPHRDGQGGRRARLHPCRAPTSSSIWRSCTS